MAVAPDRLPLPLTAAATSPPADRLPLPLGGTAPPPPKPPPKPQPKWVKISGCAVVTTASTLDVTTCLEQRRHIAPVAACLPANHTPMLDVVRCLMFTVAGLPSLTACTQAATTPTYRIATCLPVTLNAYPRLGNCAMPTVGTAPPLANCASAMQPGNPLLQGCKTPRVTVAPALSTATASTAGGRCSPIAPCSPTSAPCVRPASTTPSRYRHRRRMSRPAGCARRRTVCRCR